MNKTLLILIVVATLCACEGAPPPMTNEQIVAATKQCTDAGLRAVPFIGGPWSGDDRIVAIQCRPKESK